MTDKDALRRCLCKENEERAVFKHAELKTEPGMKCISVKKSTSRKGKMNNETIHCFITYHDHDDSDG